MELFVEHGATNKTLKAPNWCRMFVHAMTVSDLVEAGGSNLSEKIWNCKCHSFRGGMRMLRLQGRQHL